MNLTSKNNLTKYIPEIFHLEKLVNPARIFDFNNNKIHDGIIVYLCEREIRAKDNFAFQFALHKSKELNSSLKIIHPKIFYNHKPKQDFLDNLIMQTKKHFEKINLDFEIYEEKNILEYLNKLNISMLITDFNPILNRNPLKNVPFKIYEIDGHNIIPARFVSNKQEYNAATLRRKIYYNIHPFLTEYENIFDYETEIDIILKNFIENKLPYYEEFKNNPSNDFTSCLSKYINLGFISPQRIAIEVIKSDVPINNKEAFLEELIVRKELADNFCLYCSNYKNLEGIPNWAKESLNNHITDLRPYIYTLKQLENAKTHDDLWNAAQLQLKKEGKIQGYLRMYWAKKIMEWSSSPLSAVKTAILLNDKYAFDSPSSNGYTGILWAIGGLHDRAFKDFFITGKIRRMTYDSIKRKIDIKKYIEKYL